MKTLIQYTFYILIVILLSEGCSMKLLPYAINEEDYFRDEKIPSTVYEKNSNNFVYIPFNFSHDDYGRLILITIKDHPEIETVELIVQDNKKGAVAVIYYHNGEVENYLCPAYLSEKEYVKLDKNWKISEEHDFEYVFKDTPFGIHFNLDIRIKNKYRVKIKIQENHQDIKRYDVLATIGAELNEVKRFPFIYMKESAILPVARTEVSFDIDGEIMEVSKIPIKVEGNTCYRIIYSLERIPFFLNEEQDSDLKPVEINSNTFQDGLASYTFSDNEGHHEIESIEYKVSEHLASLRFSPAFPDIGALKNGSTITGNFSLGIDEVEGVIGGKYTVTNTNGNISIDIQPEKCWGSIGKKNWAAHYSYHADVEPAADDKWKIQSKWIVK